jgi:hypothetical protein
VSILRYYGANVGSSEIAGISVIPTSLSGLQCSLFVPILLHNSWRGSYTLTICSVESDNELLYVQCDANRVMAMLLRAFQIVGWCFVVAAALMAAYFIGASGRAPDEHPPFEYKDFVSILLTALGVMIAVAAVAAAIAAVWGFEFLRREMSRIARDTAIETATAEVQKIVPGLVEEAIDFAEQGQTVAGDKVAEEYGRETGQ